MPRLLALPLLAIVAGCAPVAVGPPVVTDVPKGSVTREVPAGAREARIAQDGLVVTVALTQHCTVARFDTTERTVTRERKNDGVAIDVLAGLGGAFLAGAGITGAVAGNDVDSHLSNGEVHAIGYGLIAAGAALLAIPVIDYGRTHGGTIRKTARIEKVGAVLEEDRACGAPPRGTQVFARFPTGKDAYLGATDAEGKVTADLDVAVGTDFRLVRGEQAAIHADGVDLGLVAIDALYTVREERAWKKLRSGACVSSQTEADCAGEIAYAETFPEGDHVAEAKHRLEDGRRRRAAAAERLAFARLDLDACRVPVRADDAEPCVPLEDFRRNHPESSHTAEVQAALAAGRTARARLEEAEVQAAHERERLELQREIPPATVIVPYAGGRRDVRP